MPLFDYICGGCGHRFEQLVRAKDDSEAGICPKCARPGAEPQIVRFRVGGRGDLRESSEYHGCHPSESEHVHGPGCGHGHGPSGGVAES
ncbi:MAG: zinc ribbon domain-containing protein [Bdellovibrionales bacterium]|nr:zinc ribbon domain-containing protein [Bdellovibrionales bacterium]